MIDKQQTFFNELNQNFPYAPTAEQEKLFKDLVKFVLHSERFELFLLKGYAGTGKTSVVSNLVKNLNAVNYRSVLLAPTGRAAKVIGKYADRPAHTIHRKIYFAMRRPDGGMSFSLQKNKHKHTIFIADEASMIADRESDLNLFKSRSLLEDLLRYVYTGENCKLILVGDTAQLPPVKLELSPALDKDSFVTIYGMKVSGCELSEVMRQHDTSGILFNATRIRALIQENQLNAMRFNLSFPDIIRLEDPDDIQDAIYNAYNEGLENTVLIVRSNKRANQYNQQIRISILGQDNEISTGDLIMVVKNNYFWLEDSEHVGFIANGDICEILEIFGHKDLYGFHFVEVKLRLIDYENQPPFETLLLLDTLHSETASLSAEEGSKLYYQVAQDYAHEPNKYKRKMAIKNDKYFNALQVKFSYAMTCHKTQGGQWSHVFLEQPYLAEGEDVSYLRWLYTAVTRAQNKLYLLGFPEVYFDD